jgi:hypothetical protein
MRRSTLILVIGVGIAMVIGGGASLLAARSEHAVAEAVKTCELENKQLPKALLCDADWLIRDAADLESIKDMPPPPPDSVITWDRDPNEPEGVSDPWHNATQKNIVAAKKAVFNATPWLTGSLLLAAASAVPWLWYFLLRRLAEVRAALGGNPPDK